MPVLLDMPVALNKVEYEDALGRVDSDRKET
jgi:hypothetical protein